MIPLLVTFVIILRLLRVAVPTSPSGSSTPAAPVRTAQVTVLALLGAARVALAVLV